MKKIVLIPDSFKGTLSSSEICNILSNKITEHFPSCEILSIPVADGGEGSVDCFLSFLDGQKISMKVKNPLFEEIDSFYGLIDGGKTAVVEMAAAAGLPLVENRKNPCKTTTFGVGQLILDAVSKGATKIIVGLGGSATNDGGCGAAAAVGVKFYNYEGKEFVPTGDTLKDIKRIDMSNRSKSLDGVEFITMCDIDNPMYGKNGAAYIYGPQKGADAQTVEILDQGLQHLCQMINNDLKLSLADTQGGGAAGAMGAGMIAFFGSKLQMGIETVLDLVRFQDIIKDADMVFTGEGKIDGQSLRGKVVIGVAKRAKIQNVPVTAIVGGADLDIEEAYKMGVSSIFTINRLPEDFEISRHKSKENMTLTMDNILRLIKSIK